MGLFAELRTGGILERILGAMEQRRIGIEQEFFLVDREGTPSYRADECLTRCREAAGEDLISECFVGEVSKSMVEILG